MRTFTARIVADLVASAAALVLADVFLDRFTVTAGSLPFVVILFTLFRLIIRLVMKATIVLASLAGLGAAFGSLVITDIASSGLKIRGLDDLGARDPDRLAGRNPRGRVRRGPDAQAAAGLPVAGSAAPSSDYDNAPSRTLRNRLRRRLFVTTKRLDAAMQAAAIIGFSTPATASGIAATL